MVGGGSWVVGCGFTWLERLRSNSQVVAPLSPLPFPPHPSSPFSLNGVSTGEIHVRLVLKHTPAFMASAGSVGSVDGGGGSDMSASVSVSSAAPSVGSTVITPPGTPVAQRTSGGFSDSSNWRLGRTAHWMLSVHDADDLSARSDEHYDYHYDHHSDGRAADEASTTLSAEVCKHFMLRVELWLVVGRL